MRTSVERLFGVIKHPGVGNTLWLLADKGLRAVLLMAVAAAMARYLGPEDFGKFSFVQTLVLFAGILASLGLENIAINNLVRWPEKRAQIIASAFVLRLGVGMLAALVCPIAMAMIRPSDPSAWVIAAILGLSLLPQAAEVVVYGYQAQVNAKPVVILRNATLIVCCLLRLGLLVNGNGLVALAATFVIEPALFAALLLWRANRDRFRLTLKDASWSESRSLVTQGWPLMVSAASIAVYMRIDQIMLARVQGDHAVGLLSAAVRISEVWHVFPIALLASFSPALISVLHGSGYREYEEALLRIARILVAAAVACSAFITLFSEFIIRTLYGKEFLDSADILSVHVWAGVFVSMGLLSSNWMIVTGRSHFVLWQTMLGAVVNVLLNLILIPAYGPMGTAAATVAAQSVAAFFCHALLKESRPIFWIQLRAFGIPIK